TGMIPACCRALTPEKTSRTTHHSSSFLQPHWRRLSRLFNKSSGKKVSETFNTFGLISDTELSGMSSLGNRHSSLPGQQQIRLLLSNSKLVLPVVNKSLTRTSTTWPPVNSNVM